MSNRYRKNLQSLHVADTTIISYLFPTFLFPLSRTSQNRDELCRWWGAAWSTLRRWPRPSSCRMSWSSRSRSLRPLPSLTPWTTLVNDDTLHLTLINVCSVCLKTCFANYLLLLLPRPGYGYWWVTAMPWLPLGRSWSPFFFSRRVLERLVEVVLI